MYRPLSSLTAFRGSRLSTPITAVSLSILLIVVERNYIVPMALQGIASQEIHIVYTSRSLSISFFFSFFLFSIRLRT